MSIQLVIAARQYDFTSDKGEHIDGVKVTYLDQEETGPNGKGFLPMTINSQLDKWPLLESVPGWYDMSFRQRPDSKGRPVLILDDLKFIESIKFPEI